MNIKTLSIIFALIYVTSIIIFGIIYNDIKEKQEYYKNNYIISTKVYEEFRDQIAKNVETKNNAEIKILKHDIAKIQERKPNLYLKVIQNASDDFINRLNKM